MPTITLVNSRSRPANGLEPLANSTVTEPQSNLAVSEAKKASPAPPRARPPRPARVPPKRVTDAVTYNPDAMYELQKTRAVMSKKHRETASQTSHRLRSANAATTVSTSTPANASVGATDAFGYYDLSTYMRRNMELLPDRASSVSIGVALKGLKEVDMVAFLYVLDRAPTGSDVWPDNRDQTRVPVKLTPIYCTSNRNDIKFTFENDGFVVLGRSHRTANAEKSLKKLKAQVRAHFDVNQYLSTAT